MPMVSHSTYSMVHALGIISLVQQHTATPGPDSAGKTTPPRIIVSPVDTVANETDEVVLTCRVEGNPSPVISWWKGEPLTSQKRIHIDNIKYFVSENGQELHIRHAQPRDSASVFYDDDFYQCKAGNRQGGDVSRAARLRVNFIRGHVIDNVGETIYCEKNGFASIPCYPLHESYPTQEIEFWWESVHATDKKTRVIPDHRVQIVPVTDETKMTGQAGSLTIASAVPEDFRNDSWVIYCTQKNPVTGVTLKSQPRRFKKMHTIGDEYPPNSVRPFYPENDFQRNRTFLVGANFTLKFVFVGQPTPSFAMYEEWSYPRYVSARKIIDRIPTEKVFLDAGSEHEGTYRLCFWLPKKPSKRKWKDFKMCNHFNVKINYPPTFANLKPTDTVLSYDGSKAFGCSGRSLQPRPEKRWFVNGIPLSVFGKEYTASSAPLRPTYVHTELWMTSSRVIKPVVIQCTLKNKLGLSVESAFVGISNRDCPDDDGVSTIFLICLLAVTGINLVVFTICLVLFLLGKIHRKYYFHLDEIYRRKKLRKALEGTSVLDIGGKRGKVLKAIEESMKNGKLKKAEDQGSASASGSTANNVARRGYVRSSTEVSDMSSRRYVVRRSNEWFSQFDGGAQRNSLSSDEGSDISAMSSRRYLSRPKT